MSEPPIWQTITTPILLPTGFCNCKCHRPKRARIRNHPGKIYFDANTRPIFLKPSDHEGWTAEELMEYRKTWAKP